MNRATMHLDDIYLAPKYDLCPGWDHGVGGLWGSMILFDASYGYKFMAGATGVKWSLGPIAELVGIPVYKLDSSKLHEHMPEERMKHNMSDARATRELTIRLLGAM